MSFQARYQRSQRGRQSSQPRSDTLFTAKACLCKDTEQGFSFSPCGDTPWTDINQKGSHDSYSKGAPHQTFTAGFSHTGLSSKMPLEYQQTDNQLISYTVALSRGTLLIPHKNRAKHNSCPADRLHRSAQSSSPEIDNCTATIQEFFNQKPY